LLFSRSKSKRKPKDKSYDKRVRLQSNYVDRRSNAVDPIKRLTKKSVVKKINKKKEKNKPIHKNVVDEFRFNVFIGDSKSSKGEELPKLDFPKFPVSTWLFRIKSSIKSVNHRKEKCFLYDVPYVNSQGDITNTYLGQWYTTPSSFLQSLSATIFERLKVRFRHHYLSKANKLNVLTRISMLYAITGNSYIFVRILRTLFQNWRHGTRFLNSCESDCCSTYRFCISQMSQNIRWLQSRGRCRPTRYMQHKSPKSFDLMNFRSSRKKDLNSLKSFISATENFRGEKEFFSGYRLSTAKAVHRRLVCRYLPNNQD
jgi:hypothetical protein